MVRRRVGGGLSHGLVRISASPLARHLCNRCGPARKGRPCPHRDDGIGLCPYRRPCRRGGRSLCRASGEASVTAGGLALPGSATDIFCGLCLDPSRARGLGRGALGRGRFRHLCVGRDSRPGRLLLCLCGWARRRRTYRPPRVGGFSAAYQPLCASSKCSKADAQNDQVFCADSFARILVTRLYCASSFDQVLVSAL